MKASPRHANLSRTQMVHIGSKSKYLRSYLACVVNACLKKVSEFYL